MKVKDYPELASLVQTALGIFFSDSVLRLAYFRFPMTNVSSV
jgi:hypothetical protein